MHTCKTYALDDGAFGYRVYDGDALRIEQYFAPGLSGFVPMTEAEAEAYALADVAMLELTAGEAPPADAE